MYIHIPNKYFKSYILATATIVNLHIIGVFKYVIINDSHILNRDILFQNFFFCVVCII